MRQNRSGAVAGGGVTPVMLIRWQVDYVAVGVGWDEPPSLAFRSSGAPAIACYASGSHQLNFYELDNGSWVASAVDAQVNNSGDVSCSLAFHFDRPGISYCVYGGASATSGELRYAYRHPAWITTSAGPAAWAGSSLAFSPNGHPSIALYNPANGGAAYRQAGANVSVWGGSTADPKGGGWDISLAFTPAGHPAIAYTGGDDAHPQTALIKYAVFDGAHWAVATVASGDVNSPSLGFDSSGQPIIIYAVRSPIAVMCARRGPYPLGWSITKVVDWGYSPSLAFTPAGDPAIAYIDLVYQAAVKYAVYKNGWRHYLVDQPVKQQAAAQGWYYWYSPSLAFNPVTGEPSIAYFQYDTSCIKCAVGRTFPHSFGDVLTAVVMALPRMVTRWMRPRPPVPLPPERERFRLAASGDGGDGPQRGV